MRFHFSCTRNPHTEREVYTMRTPRLRLLSAILAVALFFTLLPVSALAEGGGSNANTGLTISIVGGFNNWNPSNITMKEVSPAVYEVTIENTSYDEINDFPGFKFIKDHTFADQWGSSVTASSGTSYAVNYNDVSSITVSPGSDAEESQHNFIIRLDLTNWDWNTKTGATFTVTVAAATNTFYFDETTGTITKYNGTDTVVVIPSKINGVTVETIGNAAFQNSAVTSVTIPASVTEIGSNAFAGCTNLTSVHYEGDWSNLTIQSGNPAVQDAANAPLFDFEFTPDNTAVIVTNYKYKGTAADVTIPSRYKGKPVTMIDHAAFHDSAVTSVTIPDSVTSIPDSAFGFCSQLTNISIPNSVTYIGFSAFNSCTSLKSITLPSSLSTIESYAFYNCGNLKTIRIPVSVTSIGNCAFDVCPSSMTVTYPGSKTQWDDITKGSKNDVLENNLICAKLEATFNPDNGESISTQTIDRGGKFTEPAAPSKENHTFAGWYNGDEKFDFDADTTNAPNVLELVAKWEKSKYTVQFVSDHGSFADQTIEHGKTIETGKLTIPKVEGYTFDGWYTDDTHTTKFDFTQPIKSNTTVYAKWTANDYEVSFITEHGDPPASQNVKYNGTATDPGTLTEEGYTFDGWYADDTYSTEFDFTQPIKRNTTVYAKWTANDYEVSFVTEHGNAPTSQNVTYNGTAKDPGTLTAEGYTFDGWYADDNYSKKFDFTQPIKSNTKVYAKWTANDYEVSFITEHGAPPTSQNVQYNGTATDPGKLTAEGYTFDGWYTDDTYSTEFDFTKPITGDTKVYAKWEKNAPNTYALNVSGAFVYVDGVDVTAPAGDTSLQLEKDASVRLVADPDRMPSGMVFDRWTILNGALNADDAEKFETGRTLEEFAFTMPAEPLSIEATPRMQEEEGSDTASVILGVTLGTAATALVAWQAYDLGMSLYQEHWLPADFVMPKTRAELALLLWNTAGRPAPAAQPAFTDITDPDTAQAAQWAVETGLMTTKSADLFKPEKSVTRWKAVRSWKRVTNQNT